MFQCSKIGNDEAKLKSCWDRKLCPARRHYHRNRGKLSLERKAKRLGSSNIVEIAVKIPTGFAASVIFLIDGKKSVGIRAKTDEK
jgi:hypothetical protein